MLQRWEADSQLPVDLKPAALRFCAPLPRTRSESWQAGRPSLTCLPPFGQLRPSSALMMIRAVREEARAHEKLLRHAKQLIPLTTTGERSSSAVPSEEDALDASCTELAMRQLERRLIEEVRDTRGVDIDGGVEPRSASQSAASELRTLESRLFRLRETHQQEAMMEAVDHTATGCDAAEFLDLYHDAYVKELRRETLLAAKAAGAPRRSQRQVVSRPRLPRSMPDTHRGNTPWHQCQGDALLHRRRFEWNSELAPSKMHFVCQL